MKIISRLLGKGLLMTNGHAYLTAHCLMMGQISESFNTMSAPANDLAMHVLEIEATRYSVGNITVPTSRPLLMASKQHEQGKSQRAIGSPVQLHEGTTSAANSPMGSPARQQLQTMTIG